MHPYAPILHKGYQSGVETPEEVSLVYVCRVLDPLKPRDGPLTVYGFRVQMRGLAGTFHAAKQPRQTPLTPKTLPEPSLGDRRQARSPLVRRMRL